MSNIRCEEGDYLTYYSYQVDPKYHNEHPLGKGDWELDARLITAKIIRVLPSGSIILEHPHFNAGRTSLTPKTLGSRFVAINNKIKFL